MKQTAKIGSTISKLLVYGIFGYHLTSRLGTHNSPSTIYAGKNGLLVCFIDRRTHGRFTCNCSVQTCLTKVVSPVSSNGVQEDILVARRHKLLSFTECNSGLGH